MTSVGFHNLDGTNCAIIQKRVTSSCFFREQLGRVLGPFKNEGNEMAQAVLKENGKIVPRRTLRKLTESEIGSEVEAQKRQSFDDNIKHVLGDSMTVVEDIPLMLSEDDFAAEPEVEEDDEFLSFSEDPIHKYGTLTDQPLHDEILHAELSMYDDEVKKVCNVIGRSKDQENGIGKYDPNILLDMTLYDVKFNDGKITRYMANTIAQNIFDQVDNDGYLTTKFNSIRNHRKSVDVIEKNKSTLKTQSGKTRLIKSTVGWNLLVEFTDGTSQWIPLRIFKEVNPIKTAD